MKTVLLVASLVIAIPLLPGCTTGGSGGIDDVTMRGIEDSNRAADDAIQQQTQNSIDQTNFNAAQ